MFQVVEELNLVGLDSICTNLILRLVLRRSCYLRVLAVTVFAEDLNNDSLKVLVESSTKEH